MKFNQPLRMMRAICCVFGALAVQAAATTFHVSPQGNDNWSGEPSDPDAAAGDGPLATLDGARRKVRAHFAEGVAGPVTVLIRGGEYTLDQTLIFGVEDSGTEQSPITYRAYPGEKPVFTGGVRLGDWKKLDMNPKHASKEALGNLWVHDLPEEVQGIRVEGIEDKQPVRFLHFEGLTFRHGLRDTWQEDDKGLQHDWEMYDKGNAVLRFRHAEDASVRGCTFQASSGTAVRLDLHCQRITVADSVFSHLGGTGILLSGYAPGTKDVNKHNTITNNYLHHVGALYLHSPAHKLGIQPVDLSKAGSTLAPKTDGWLYANGLASSKPADSQR